MSLVDALAGVVFFVGSFWRDPSSLVVSNDDFDDEDEVSKSSSFSLLTLLFCEATERLEAAPSSPGGVMSNKDLV